MHIPQFDFSGRLDSLMKENSLTKYRLAKDLNCAPTTITNWLNGKKPNDLTLTCIADYFKVSVEYLKGETDDRGQKVKPAPGDGDGLSDKDIRLLEWFRSLPAEKQKAILYDEGAPEGLA